MGHFVSDSVGVKCAGVEKQQLLRFLCGIGFSGMEQHFHAGDVGLSIQRQPVLVPSYYLVYPVAADKKLNDL